MFTFNKIKIVLFNLLALVAFSCVDCGDTGDCDAFFLGYLTDDQLQPGQTYIIRISTDSFTDECRFNYPDTSCLNSKHKDLLHLWPNSGRFNILTRQFSDTVKIEIQSIGSNITNLTTVSVEPNKQYDFSQSQDNEYLCDKYCGSSSKLIINCGYDGLTSYDTLQGGCL